MSDFIVAPLTKHPWYKRTWGILLIIIGALAVLFFTWFGFLVRADYQLIKSGKLKPITNFDSEFTADKAGGQKNSGAAAVELAPAASPTRGEEGAAITVVQFGDFQCPFSAKEFPIIRPLMETVTGVKFVYRDFPLVDIHPGAFGAAEASHCAQEQGKYWAFHDQLFLNQVDLSPAALETYAKKVGLDEEAYKTCVKSEKYRAQVLRDVQDGMALGVRGTPTFFINGVKFEGAIPKAAWETIFDKLKSL